MFITYFIVEFIMQKIKSLFTPTTINKVPMLEILVNTTCIKRTPVYSEHKSWS